MTPVLAQRRRSDRAFERIYRRYVGDVYRYAFAVLHNSADAEDVAQTTFLNAYRAYQEGERPRNPQNWLIAIAHNVCRQRFRQSLRRPEEVSYDDGIGSAVPEEEQQGPTVADIRRALRHLAFNQRAALVMRELEGRSYAEIAEILGLSVSAVETLLFRARRALREQLEGSLTCREAERAISLQADGKLGRSERGALRAHLRECAECARLARRQRAQRNAFKALALVPVPSSLTSFAGGGAAVGGAAAAKVAAVVAAGAVAAGAGYEGAKRIEQREPRRAVPVSVAAAAAVAPAEASAVHAAARAAGRAAKAKTPAEKEPAVKARRVARGHERKAVAAAKARRLARGHERKAVTARLAAERVRRAQARRAANSEPPRAQTRPSRRATPRREAPKLEPRVRKQRAARLAPRHVVAPTRKPALRPSAPPRRRQAVEQAKLRPAHRKVAEVPPAATR